MSSIQQLIVDPPVPVPAPAAVREARVAPPWLVQRAQLRRSLAAAKLSVLPNGLFFAVVGGGVTPLLCSMVGLNDRWFGFVSAIPAMAILTQLPGTLLLNKLGGRKGLLIVTGFAHRLSWAAIGAVPWLLGSGPAAIATLVALIAASSAVGNLCGLSWQSLMSDLIPPRRRGSYMGGRMRLFNCSLLCGSLLVAWALPRPNELNAAAWVMGVCAVAAVSGAGEIIGYFFVTEPPMRGRRSSGLGDLARPLADPAFRPFLLFGMTVTAGTSVLGPFLWRHFLEAQQLSPLKTTLILQTAPILASIAVVPFWGRAIDRFGTKPTLALATVGGTVATICWPAVSPAWWAVGLVIAAAGQSLWAGVDMGMMNALLRVGSVDPRTGRGGATYVAAYNVACAVAGVAAGLAAGEAAQRMRGVEWIATAAERFAAVGLQFNPYVVLLVVSILLRLAAVAVVLPRVPRDGPRPTVESVQAMAGQLYSGLSVLLFASWRQVGRRVRG